MNWTRRGYRRAAKKNRKRTHDVPTSKPTYLPTYLSCHRMVDRRLLNLFIETDTYLCLPALIVTFCDPGLK